MNTSSESCAELANTTVGEENNTQTTGLQQEKCMENKGNDYQIK